MSSALDAAQRLLNYLKRRSCARGIDYEQIHSFDAGEDSEAELKASDITDVVQGYYVQMKLLAQLAEIRDMFPSPPNGSELDKALLAALAHPEDVAPYVQAQLKSLQEREPVSHQFQANGKWFDFTDSMHYQNTVKDGRWPIRALYDSPVLEKRPDAVPFGIIDPDYARVFTIARCIAWADGYSCCVQGSFTRDLDLLLTPWTDAARADVQVIVDRIAAATGLRDLGNPSDKPHGRKAWTLVMTGFYDPRFVDISIFAPAKAGGQS